MKKEDERVLKEFCAGKVIKEIDFPSNNSVRILFESDAGIEISESGLDPKGLVVRMVRLSESG